jgi:hypothetical protein
LELSQTEILLFQIKNKNDLFKGTSQSQQTQKIPKNKPPNNKKKLLKKKLFKI